MESDDGSSPGGVPADQVVERRVMHGHHGDGVHPLVEQVGKDRALGLHVVPGRRYVGDLDAELSDVEGGLPNALPEQIEESRRFLGRDDDDSHVPSCRSDKVGAAMRRAPGSAVYRPAIRSGIVKNATAAKLMNATPQASALHPARPAAAGSRCPIKCPTRTAAAELMPNGTMKVRLARLRAIWWPASEAGSSRAIKAVANPKTPSSNTTCLTTGMPSFSSLARPGQSGASGT